jgi:hypothetical protein
VATAVRRTVELPKAGVILAVSLALYGGDFFLAVIQHKTVRFNQYTFMLSLEVMGPGGSLSTVLIATPYWRDAS